jgi:hypothetical protein
LDLFDLILQETTLNGNKNKMQNMPPTKRARITDWSPPTLADIRALLGVVINMGLHPMSDITDYFSQTWVNKMPFFSDVFPRDEFLLLFWNLHFAHAEGQGKLKKEEVIKFLLDKIRSKCIQHYSPSNIVAVDESTISVSFKTYNPMKPVKFGLKMFVLSDSMNGYIYITSSHTLAKLKTGTLIY